MNASLVRIGRLQSHSRLAAMVCRLVGLAIPFLLLATWSLEGVATGLLHQVAPFGELAPGTPLIWAAALLGLLPSIALACSLFAAGRCFSGFAGANWFGVRQPHAIAASGRWLVASGALSLIMPTVLGLILTIDAPPGSRVLTFSVSSTSLIAMLFGLLIWALGQVWAKALELAAENERYV